MTAPLWRWPGGKRKQAAAIVGELTKHPRTRYVEPFLGAGSVALAMEGPALLSDHDAPIMRLWAEVKDNPERLFVEASEVSRAMTDGGITEARYKALRDREALRSRPADLLVLLGLTFNGLYRRGAFNAINAPFNNKQPSVPNLDRLLAVSARLQTSTLLCASYVDVLSDCRKGDVIYLDPPYVGTQGYGRDKPWTWEHLGELIDHAYYTTIRGATVVLSHSEVPFGGGMEAAVARELATWRTIEVDAPSSIGAKGDRRSKRREVLAILEPGS